MTEYDIKLPKDKLVALLNENDAMAELVTSVINQVLEAQMSEHLGAERYAQTDERQVYRNGYRERKLYTRVGTLTLVCRRRAMAVLAQIFLNNINAVKKHLCWG